MSTISNTKNGVEKISVSITQGHRKYMEDTYIVEDIIKRNGDNIKVLCVFDGHGGSEVSEHCKTHFTNIFKKHYSRLPEIDVCLRKTYQELDNRCFDIGQHCGSTALTILKKGKELWIANCGDSEAVIGFNDKTYRLITECHKVEDEKDRLEKLGAKITYDDGCARINRMLNLARSIGDYHLKQYVISSPYVRCIKLNKKAEYVILASDGLWDVYDPETIDREIRQLKFLFLAKGFDMNKTTDAICYELIKKALMRGSTDNICILLTFF